MMLQEIIKNKKRSWLRLCSLYNVNKWDLIDYVKETVYASKYLINDGLEVTTKNCLLCGVILHLGIYKEKFIVIPQCSCAKDGSHSMTNEKLKRVLTDAQIKKAFEITNRSKRQSLPNTLDFWMNKGLTKDQALLEISKVQKHRSAKSPASAKGAKGFSIRTVEYWINKGLSSDDAIKKIKEIQTTNGLAYYKKKYGDAGVEMFNTRIHNWLNSSGNKQMIANRSKKSIELFSQLGCGDYGVNEKTVRGKQKVHRVDFLYNNKIIEFYGDYWHGNPKIYNNDKMIRKKKITDIWAHDEKKVKDLLDKGFEVMIVWESDYVHNPKQTLQQCKEFINEN